MMDVTSTNVFLFYNLAASLDLGGVSLLVIMFKPMFIFSQEVTLDSDSLVKVPGLHAYQGVSKVDQLGGTKPGTASLWRTDVEGIVVSNLVPRRLQNITTGNDGIFINLYPPSGSQGKRERRVLLGQELFPLIQAAPTRPTLVGDWNFIIHRNEVEPHGGAGGAAAEEKPG